MRDPNRIKTICELLERAMNTNPDIRFGQLLMNTGYFNSYKILTHDGELNLIGDPFNYDDDKIIEALQSYISTHELQN